MIPFEQAFQTAMSCVPLLGVERADLDTALNRVLAEDVVSDIDMPPFNKSAMDGYACRRADLANELEVLEVIAAGAVPTRSIGANQSAKIMTGAMVPGGADCVIMVEYVENPAPNTVRFVGDRTADNICIRGEDVRVGDVVLRAGQRIGPQHVAVLASVGCVRPPLRVRPRVAIIATGEELVAPAEKPGPGMIRNSNGSQLAAQVSAAASVPVSYGTARDTERSLDQVVKRAMAETDVLLLSGGVSMGDFDLVPGVLKSNGFELLFEKVAIKPGKPTVFGRAGDVFCFGLPGNPVSTFVLFDILVKPFVYKMMGHDYVPLHVRMPLGRTVSRRRTERLSWIPVVLADGVAVPVEYHGSAHSHALCSADGLTSVPVGVAELPEGTLVDVRPI